MMYCLFVLFFLCVYPSSSAKLPTLKPCYTNDQSQLDACTLGNFKASLTALLGGDPKRGIPRLDPLDIKEIAIKQKNKQIGYDLILTDCKFSGLSNSKYIRTRTNVKKRYIEMDVENESGYTMIGNYNISGKILLLPVTGNGKFNFNLTGLKTKFRFDYDVSNKKGKEYIDVKDVTVTNTIRKGQIHLENLFNGNKLLGDNMNQVLNDNWQEVSKDIEPAISKAVSTLYKKVLSAVFYQVPYDEVFPEK